MWKGLGEIARALCPALRQLFAVKRRGQGGDGDCCLHLPAVYKRPDPLIYAQYYLMAMGLSVSWDNPDIELFDAAGSAPTALGAPVASSELEPDRDYRVRVRVWNGSYDAPAVGLPVQLSYLSFGVGTTSHPIAATFIDLGVKGSPRNPGFAVFDWRTPSTAGHYCLQARLDWSDDANPDNNLGQENVTVSVAHSPATSTFTLRNDAAVRRRFVLEADAYRLRPPPPCEQLPDAHRGAERRQTRLAESRARWERARREQGLGSAPIPAGWTVRIEPAELLLGPAQEREIAVSVELPVAAAAREALNVNAFALREGEGEGRDLVGGVTLYVEQR